MKQSLHIFTYRGVSFEFLIAEKIQNNISPHIIGLMAWTGCLNDFIEQIRPKALLSNGTRPDDTVLAELCRKKNIPDILISHGSHVPPKNEYERLEWGEHGRLLLRAPFSGLALQSPLAEEYLDAFPTESEIFITGPLIWGSLVKRGEAAETLNALSKRKIDYGKLKIIVHAGTPKPNKFLRPHVYETPDEYIQSIRDMVESVKGLVDVLLIVRFRPSVDIGIDDIKRLVDFSDKAVLSVDEPFIKVLGMADLLVSFSSTTIEEALQNRIPVVLYGGGGRYKHVNAYQVRRGQDVAPRAVYHVPNSHDLQYALRKVLNLNMAACSVEFSQYAYPTEKRVPLAEILKRQLLISPRAGV